MSFTSLVASGLISPNRTSYQNHSHLQHNAKDQSCQHLSLYHQEELIKNYEALIQYSLYYTFQSKLAKTRKPPLPTCHVCDDLNLNHLHACLHCVFLTCWQHEGQTMKEHLEKKRHFFSVHFWKGRVYCLKCGDYVYHLAFEEIYQIQKRKLEDYIYILKNPDQKRLNYESWQPNTNELGLIKRKAKLQSGHFGLRGLRNLGSTCFMNSILQTFLHNPPLRSFFLSDQHNQKLCQNEQLTCFACQMDSLFTEFYSGNIKPFVPTQFLWSMWMTCKELVGYAQQDAHEFFIGALNRLHSSLSTADSGGVSPVIQHCSCIVHRLFNGTFQSQVTCLQCGNVTRAYDPFLDISLDVRPVFSPQLAHFPEVPFQQQQQQQSLKETHSLYECLEHFTHPENLQYSEYRCSACQHQKPKTSLYGATKQLSLKKLPVVLSLQLKRYKHQLGEGGKIQMHVRFPLELDLKPFTTSQLATQSKNEEKDDAFEYSLFAVIVHHGTLDSGHYISYIRQSGMVHKWFKLDDHMVTVVEWEEVENCEAYMCFYLKKYLEYQ